MAGGISVHAVDVSHGRPAQGMRVDVYSLAGVRKLLHRAVSRGGALGKRAYALFAELEEKLSVARRP